MMFCNLQRFFWSSVLTLLLGYSNFALSDAITGMDIAPTPVRQALLFNLVRHDCGSCHGLRLGGGLGLPLTPAALKEKSPDALKETILYGRGGTAMPPWRPFINEAEAAWIVRNLLKGMF